MPYLLVILALLALPAQAADYSTDDLCRAIGETPRIALQPRDRLFLEQKCTCFVDGCAAKGGKKAAALAKAQKAAEREEAERERMKAEEERKKVEARASTAPLRAAYWACVSDQTRTSCRDELVALQDACEATGQFLVEGHFDLALCQRD